MNIEELRIYCLAKPCVEESFPFDEHTLVFKVANKMFALSGLQRLPAAVNLKCDPERAIKLRESYGDITPGFHMNKKHWNTVILENELSDDFMKENIDHSYDLVVSKLPKKDREVIAKMKESD